MRLPVPVGVTSGSDGARRTSQKPEVVPTAGVHDRLCTRIVSPLFMLDPAATKTGSAWRGQAPGRADATITSMVATALHRGAANRIDPLVVSALADLAAPALVRSLCGRRAVSCRGSRDLKRPHDVEPLVDSNAPAAPSEEEKSDGSNLTNQTGHGA